MENKLSAYIQKASNCTSKRSEGWVYCSTPEAALKRVYWRNWAIFVPIPREFRFPRSICHIKPTLSPILASRES